MACLDMYNQNKEHKQAAPPPHSHAHGAPPISPRISFSNDFIESAPPPNSHMVRSYRDAPVSSDFEFSVTNYSMMSADELFSHGKLLPLKESCSSHHQQFQRTTTTTTLRDELLVEDEEEDIVDFSLRPPKSSTRWKGFLGLKKSHIGSRRNIIERAEGSSSRPPPASFLHHHEQVHPGKPSSQMQEMMTDGGSSSKNMNQDQFRF